MLNIDSMKQGIVIDHIKAGNSMNIYQYLHLDELDCSIAIIKNARSGRYGKKDIIKIEGDIRLDLTILGFIDPDITVNIIEDGKIVCKKKLTLPDEVKNVIKCKNPRCITSVENVDHIFKLANAEKRLYRCVYCEQEFQGNLMPMENIMTALLPDEQRFLSETLSHCMLCPRRCGADRLAGKTGFCGAGAAVKVARAALHFWEEPCLSGESGSGTVFFSYCTLKCVFCQNYGISTEHAGVEITVERLAEVFLRLQRQGANNINLVTPTHYLPQIILALRRAKKQGLSVPVVYNTGGFETVEALRLLDGLVDVYLPDFKYADAVYAEKYSRAKEYPAVAEQAVTEMLRQVGKPVLSADGMMQKGVIVRHLMLPGLIEDTKAVLRLLHERFGENIFVSLMNQYTPLAQVKPYPELDCTLDPLDYDDAISYAQFIGIKNGFIQEDETAKESFIPAFDGEGVLKE